MNADPKRCVVFEVDMKIWPYRNSRHLRDQLPMLLIDEKVSLAWLFSLLPADAATRSAGFNAVREIVTACGESLRGQKRLSEIGRLFGIREDGAAPFPQNRRGASAKAS